MTAALIAAPVAISRAFSPGHLTGFVEIPPQGTSYLNHGSRGAGFSVDRGITTAVQVYENKQAGFQIMINSIKTDEAEVSRWVASEYLKLVDRPYFISVEHEASIPIGYGLGSSGAAALSLSYALNDALDAGLGKSQAAQIAHHAEIACKTGLGTVIAEYAGGFEMRTGVGAPGIGTVEKIDLDGYKAVILCMSPISTRSFLTNHINMINGLGSKMLKRLQKTKSVQDFLQMSFEFAESLGLTKGQCREPIMALKSGGFDCGVALFGHTVFTLVPKDQSRHVQDILSRFEGTLLVCNVDSHGARVL